MKKIAFLFILFSVCIVSNAQKKNGTVYSEHPTIETTKAVMKALQDGDEDGFLSFFADSVYFVSNGKGQKRAKEYIRGTVKYWSAYDNLEIKDAKPAYPDAIEYKGGETWVQDWLLFTATHKKTGINIEERFHHMYRFNEDGKIDVLSGYFNNDVFEEIANSQTKKENGIVYINHPYINKVRKLLNARANHDIDTWASFFNPKARFRFSWMKDGDSSTLEKVKANLEKMFETEDFVKFEQRGYPDCVYYAKNDSYSVYSWWILKTIKDGKKMELPIMLTHVFDKEGKVIQVFAYYSTNHLE